MERFYSIDNLVIDREGNNKQFKCENTYEAQKLREYLSSFVENPIQYKKDERRQFAAMAMAGLLANPNYSNSSDDYITEASLQSADRLIAALNK